MASDSQQVLRTTGHPDAAPRRLAATATGAPIALEDAIFFDDEGRWRPEALQIFPWTSSSSAPTRTLLLGMLRANTVAESAPDQGPPILQLPTSQRQRRFRAITLGETHLPKPSVGLLAPPSPKAGGAEQSQSLPSSTSGVASPSTDGSVSGSGNVPPLPAQPVQLTAAQRPVSYDYISTRSRELTTIAECDGEDELLVSEPRLIAKPPVTHQPLRATTSSPTHPPASGATSRATSPTTAAAPVPPGHHAAADAPATGSGKRTPRDRPASPSAAAALTPSGTPTAAGGGSGGGGGGGMFSLRALREKLSLSRATTPTSPTGHGAPSTPRAGEAQPRVLRFHFSKATTSSKDAQQLILDVEAALLAAGVLFERTGFVFLCKAPVRAPRAPRGGRRGGGLLTADGARRAPPLGRTGHGLRVGDLQAAAAAAARAAHETARRRLVAVQGGLHQADRNAQAVNLACCECECAFVRLQSSL